MYSCTLFTGNARVWYTLGSTGKIIYLKVNWTYYWCKNRGNITTFSKQNYTIFVYVFISDAISNSNVILYLDHE